MQCLLHFTSSEQPLGISEEFSVALSIDELYEQGSVADSITAGEVNTSDFTLFSPGLSVQLVRWVLGADKAQYCDSCNSKRCMQAFDVKIERGFARINSNRLMSKKRTTKHRLMSLPSVHLHLTLQLAYTHKSSSFTS